MNLRYLKHVCMLSLSVMSNSLWSHELYSTRLFCPWNFSGKNTRVGCHLLLPVIFLTQWSNLCLFSLNCMTLRSLSSPLLKSLHWLFISLWAEVWVIKMIYNKTLHDMTFSHPLLLWPHFPLISPSLSVILWTCQVHSHLRAFIPAISTL